VLGGNYQRTDVARCKDQIGGPEEENAAEQLHGWEVVWMILVLVSSMIRSGCRLMGRCGTVICRRKGSRVNGGEGTYVHRHAVQTRQRWSSNVEV
jgi:hypothetical protein